MGGGHVAQRGLGLGLDELLVGLDGEDGAGGVGHLPHDDGGDVDGVAVQVVDLELVGLEVVDLDGDLPPAGQRWDECEPWASHGADVAAEELTHAGLTGDDDDQAGGQQHEGEHEDHCCADGERNRHGPACVGVDGGPEDRDAGADDEGKVQDQSEEGCARTGGPGGPLDDVDMAGDVFGSVAGMVRGVG